MKKNIFLLSILGVFALLYSCSSPSDLDVNKRIEPVDPSKVRVFPIIREITIEENGNQVNSMRNQNFEISKSEIVVDTIKNPPLIWMQVVLERKEYSKFRRLALRSVNLKLDSFLMTGLPYSFAQDSYITKCWAKIKIQRGPKKDFDTLIDVNKNPNYFEMSVILNKNLHEILANGYGKIYDRRFTVSRRDTVVFDSILKVRYDTIWVHDYPIIKKEEYWEIKELHLEQEEVIPFADSLIINFKIRMKY